MEEPPVEPSESAANRKIGVVKDLTDIPPNVVRDVWRLLAARRHAWRRIWRLAAALRDSGPAISLRFSLRAVYMPTRCAEIITP